MTITVKFFASLREQIGTNQLKLSLQTPLTMEQVWANACRNTPLPEHLLMALNQEYVQADAIVKEGDEVAFFPPVTGG